MDKIVPGGQTMFHHQTEKEMKVGDFISGKYNNRRVSGTITYLEGKFVWVRLNIDYVGKNDSWLVGDEKKLSIKKLKKK